MDPRRTGGAPLQGFGSMILDKDLAAAAAASTVGTATAAAASAAAEGMARDPSAVLDPQQVAADLVRQFSMLNSPQQDAAFKRQPADDGRSGRTPRGSTSGCASVSFSPVVGSPPSLPPLRMVAARGLTQLSETDAAIRIQAAWRRYYHLCQRSFCQYGDEALRLVQRYVSGVGFVETAASKAHLVLHFDLNKTILISDKAQGASQHHMVNVLLSECVWGRMMEGPSFIPVGRLATDRPANDPELMSYRNFLDSFVYPYLEGSSPEISEENTRRKRNCHDLKRTFTDAGQPGAMFRGVFDALNDRLAQPESEQTAFFEDGSRRVLPSFFELLLHLDRTGREFTIVFRTFGTDITDVIEEVNLFATGQHPSYPGVQLSGQGRTDLRIKLPDQTGAFLRWGPGKDDTLLALGMSETVLSSRKLTRELLAAEAAAVGAPLLEGFHAIYSAIRSAALGASRRDQASVADGTADASTSGRVWMARHGHGKNAAFAIRDYYPYWKQRNERSQAGKLLLVDPSATDVIQIFFDDNVGYSQAHIVDARDSKTGKALPFSQVQGAHLLRVEPVNAILDAKYFVRAINEAELTILRRVEKYNQDYATSPAGSVPASPSAFDGSAFSGLTLKGRSGVARVSLRAKQRWEWALRNVLIMVRLANALTS